jgi:hypothetical protein
MSAPTKAEYRETCPTSDRMTALRITASWCSVIVLVLVAMPAVQVSHSTNYYDHTAGAMVSILHLVPAIVFAAFFSISAYRVSQKSPFARFAAIAHLIATFTFSLWILFELLF